MLEQLELNEILAEVTNSKNVSLKEMLKDKEAAKLGDAYLNFVYSAFTISRLRKNSH